MSGDGGLKQNITNGTLRRCLSLPTRVVMKSLLANIRLPIAVKAVLLIAGLVLMSGLANWFCLQRIDMLEQLAGQVNEQVTPARLVLTEAKARVESFGLATYKIYAAGDADTAKLAAAAMKGEYSAALIALDNVVGYFPKTEEDVKTIRVKLEMAHAIGLEIAGHVAANDRSTAREQLDIRFDPARDDVAGQLNRLVNILGGEAREMMEQAAEAKASILTMTVVTLLGGSLATLILAVLLAHLSVARPLRRLAAKMVDIAQGNFAADIDGLKRGDEVGAMARAVAVFKRNGLALRALEAEQANERERAEADKRAALATLADAFEREVLSVADAVADAANELDRFATSMQAVADQSDARAKRAASLAAETTEGAAAVAAGVEEMSATVGDIGGQVLQAGRVVAAATGRAEVAVANSEVLATAVQHIDRVVGLITGIAGQTNLLALNATIEAARAGNAGRGFAVVAQEVKSLAGQTTQALAEISEKTASVRQAAQGVNAAIRDISQVVGQISTISAVVANSVEQQELTSRRISQSVEETAEHTRKAAATIADVSHFAGQTGQVAEQIQTSAGQLNRQAAVLHRQAQDFANRVRAG